MSKLGIRDIFELGNGRTAGGAGRPAAFRWPSAQSRPKLIATAHDEPLPLSASQLRSWFAYRVDGPSPVNNIPFAARLTGPWDIDALIAAVGDVVARHEILRTTYIDVDGVPYQVVTPVGELPVRRAAGDGEAWLQEQLDAERRHCFELDREWPIRVAVLRTARHQGACAVAGRPSHRVRPLVGGRAVRRRDHRLPRASRRRGPVVGAASGAVRRLRCLATHFLWASRAVRSQRSPPSSGTTGRQLAGLPEDSGLRPDFPRPPLPSGDGESVDIPYRLGYPRQARRPVPRIGRHRVHGAASRRRGGAAQGGKRRRHPIGHAGRRAHRSRIGPADRLFRQHPGAAQRLARQPDAA